MADPLPKISVAPPRSSAPAGAAERTSVAAVVASVICAICLAGPLPAAASERLCSDWNAELITVVGRVEIDGPSGWAPAHRGTKLCSGQSVRVLDDSRATLILLDQNRTVLTLAADSTMTLAAPGDADVGTLVRLLKGLIHVISRDPRSLSFDTPYANAGLEGTEFVIAALPERTDVTVIEGAVRLSNASGAISVPSGARGTAAPQRALRSEPIADPLGALGWTPHHVGILTPADHPADEAAERTERAARRLAAGSLGAAVEELARARALAPERADPLALSAMIALAGRRYDDAADLARQAVAVEPAAPSGWLALSYAREAQYRHVTALDAARSATGVAPGHAFAWARVGELALSARDYPAAREAARRAIDLQPALAHAHTVLGFAELHDARTRNAEQAFRAAVNLDAGAPLPRLGLALALLAGGERVAARQQMELAVGLDPTNALVRAYMAKIYGAESRSELSGTLLDLAKVMRPDDPTAWYYDALRKQGDNRLVEAVHDLRTANRLNDGQPVYRSRLLLDEDLPSRSAGVGRLYAAAGAEHLALADAWQATMRAPDDYAGHRLLADVYAYLPRHQIARVNELYQAQLLQPETLAPVRPQLAEANLFVLDTLGPSALAHSEFQSLVRENGLGVLGSTVAAGNGTYGIDVAVHGLNDRLSYSAGLFDWQTEGFRPNNDLAQTTANALLQFRPSAATTFTAELRHTETDKGDLAFLFDRDAYNRWQRQHETSESLRLGLRHGTGHGTWLASIIADQSDARLDTGESLRVLGQRDGQSADVQRIVAAEAMTWVVGGRYSTQKQKILPLNGSGLVADADDLASASAYVYSTWSGSPRWALTAGVSVQQVANDYDTFRQIGPKLGLEWNIAGSATLRAAVFRTLQPTLLSKHYIIPTLEPTHVAGFNQQFFGSEGEDAWRAGIALDFDITPSLFAGIELSRRDVDVPVATIVPTPAPPLLIPTFGVAELDSLRYAMPRRQETNARGYLFWTPGDRMTLTAALHRDRFDSGQFVLAEGFTSLQTNRVPVEFNYFSPSGWNGGATVTWVDQDGDFRPNTIGDGVETTAGQATFTTLDLSFGYRLPSRRGSVSLNMLNALDEDFRFQDIDPENPRLISERMLMLRLTLSY